MKNLQRNNSERGFTLVELLVVIAILAVLATAVVVALNPSELLAQSRDSKRISDLSTLKTAISLFLTDTLGGSALAPSYTTCYLSTVSGTGTSTAKCGVFVGGITTNASSSSANYRKNDATGWVPINFNLISIKSPLSALPVDPTNTSAYYYAYTASSTSVFEIDAFMESRKYGKNGSKDVVQNDGGDNSNAYESGSSLTL